MWADGDTSDRLLRGHLVQLDVRQQSQGGRDRQRHLRIPDNGAERRSRRHPSEGDDDAGRGRDLDDGPCGRALKLQRPLPTARSGIVACGVKDDPAGPAK